MVDLRAKQLAKLVVNFCINAKPGEDVTITGSTEAEDFVEELYKQLVLKGANPLVRLQPKNIDYFFFKHANKKQLQKFPKYWYDAVRKADAHIIVESEFNTRDLTSCDPKKIALRAKVIDRIESSIVKKRYIYVPYPCQAYAIEAEMSLDEYKDFVYSSCLIDWKKFGKKFARIKKHFHRGKVVHLVGEGIDLKFSIKDKNAVYDDGRENLPGGEVYMAPIKKSLNGYIKFDFPSLYEGKEIKDIFLEFKNGKVINYSASKNKKMLKAALESDKNASFIGEFGIGVNPMIKQFTNHLLFDEKMDGTVHLALGMAYEENGGGNDSVVHWDLIKDMSNAKMILDGKVVQENGKWKI
ncbi:MAG: aminopeptidase [Nanoarchaeota archaeon]|nr:aminopeptidase [Nanoarchaeota archaeon]